MKATVLRDFFDGRLPSCALAADLEGAFSEMSSQSRRLNMEDMSEEFELNSTHLVSLCDAVLAGEIPAEALEALGFGLIASDSFVWDSDTPDGHRVGQALYDWSAPEINYALTPATVSKFRHRLLTGQKIFTKADLYSASA